MWETITKMEIPLTNFLAHDGSRQFASLPKSLNWYDVRDHVPKLEGATLTNFVCDDVTEAWIDFQFHGMVFSINDQCGEYWFFAYEETCPEFVLRAIVVHFSRLLSPN